MPRGKYVNHKGRGRSFTSAEELAREQKDMQNKKNAKARRPKKAEGEETDSDEEDSASDDAEPTTATTQPKVIPEGDSESEESSEDENRKSKGVEGLIEIENPNRRVVKQKKLSQLEDTSGGPGSSSAASGTAGGGGAGATSSAPELSRREREAIEKQKAKERYQKLHAEGKTEEARKDLARLAIIRKQREEAAAKRAEEATQKEALKQTKQSETAKALGKK